MATMDRTAILDMLARGQITADEAVRLLDAPPAAEAAPEKFVTDDSIAVLKAEEPAFDVDEIKIAVAEDEGYMKPYRPEEDSYVVSGNGRKPRWLKIRVRDMQSGRNKVSVNLPLGIVTFGLGVARRFGADMGDVEIDDLLALIKEGEPGLLVDVEDDEDGDHVQIYLE